MPFKSFNDQSTLFYSINPANLQVGDCPSKADWEGGIEGTYIDVVMVNGFDWLKQLSNI